MLKRLAIIAALSILAATPALAGEAGGKDVGQYVDLQPVGLPIVVHGRLVNYVFVHVRLNLTSSANTSKLRDKEPYFRDALVRDAHRMPFTLPNDYEHVDTARLTATLVREATAIVGSGQIRSAEVSSQAAQRRLTATMLGL